MEFLPLGTIVGLKEAKDHQKALITARLPLFDTGKEVGYFDYAACAYPQGQLSQDSYFFNKEDIKEVYHQGFVDDEEKNYQKLLKESLKETKYKHLKLADFK